MTDWRMLATAKGLEPEERLTGPLEALEAQFAGIEARIALETEPAIYYVLRQGDGDSRQ